MTFPAALRLLPALLALAVVGCIETAPTDTSTGAGDCTVPTISELVDQTVNKGKMVTIPVQGTPCVEGAELTITWSLDSKPLDSEQDSTSIDASSDPSNPTFTPDAVGTYVWSAYASDADGNNSEVVIVVITVNSGNDIPVADCGLNQTAEENDRVDLDGSASKDPEGAELTYDWSVSSSPDCSSLESGDVFNGDQVVASVVPDCAGTFVISLVVDDGENYSEPAYCSVTVASDNASPIADAGTSETLSPCTAPDFHLDGWGSYDPDGDAITYAWSLLSAPAGSDPKEGKWANDPNQAAPYFHWDVPGEYIFQLQVCDAVGCSAPDIVTLTFVDPSENNPPTANAGDDQTITSEPDCSTASYVWTCEECPADSVTVDGSASIDSQDGDELDFYWTETSGELTIAAPASPTTEVSTPSFASTYGTAITKTWDVKLTVNDCSESDDDTVTITYTCTGSY